MNHAKMNPMVNRTGGSPHDSRKLILNRAQKQKSAPSNRYSKNPSFDTLTEAARDYPKPARYSNTLLLHKRLINRLPFQKISKKRRIFGVLMLLALTSGVLILMMSQKTSSRTQSEFFRNKLSTLLSTSREIEKHNTLHPKEAAMENNIASYNDAILSGSLACQEMDNQTSTVSKELLEPYSHSIQQINLFCSDFHNVTDYARKVSQATRQLVTHDANLITNNTSVNAVQDTYDILGFTRNDISRLTSHPIQDPANIEMLTMLDDSLKVAAATLADPSDANKQAFADNITRIQNNLMTARQYFWKNTVRIDALQRSVNRLHGLFN